VEFQASLKLQAIGRILERINPERWFAYFNSIVLKISTDAFGQLPAEWGLNKPPKDRMSNPIFNDKIVELLHEGKVEIVPALRNITASGDIELSNGHVISDVDTIILCTGYTYDFSHVPESVNPTRFKNAQWEATDRTNGRELYRLYQGIFSLDCPDSLAYLGVAGYPSSQFPLYDLVTMALAQVWKGAVKLPSQEEMNAEVDKRHATLLSRAAEDGLQIVPFEMDAGAWTKWLHDVAGTGFNERFNYGLKGWWYWLKDFRNMSNLMSGVNSPHLWRLFDGRRKKWDGAAKAIQKVNEDISRRKREASGSRKTKMK
jgi:dimethylaniline monooxygenase (N-oxide forming)